MIWQLMNHLVILWAQRDTEVRETEGQRRKRKDRGGSERTDTFRQTERNKHRDSGSRE